MLISSNKNLTIKEIEKYPDKNWDWSMISNNPNITIEFINKHLDKDLNWNAISHNKNLTIEMVEKYPLHPWHWGWISCNPFEKDYQKELKKLKFKYIEEELIQKTWHPIRFMEWCLDEDQKKNIFNNDIIE